MFQDYLLYTCLDVLLNEKYVQLSLKIILPARTPRKKEHKTSEEINEHNNIKDNNKCTSTNN